MAGDATYATKPIVALPAPRAGFKNALDVAIEKANARGTPVPKQATFTQRSARAALDLSEIMEAKGETKTSDKPKMQGTKKK